MEYKKLKFNYAVVLGGVGYSPLGGLNRDGVYLTVPASLASGPYYDALVKNKVMVDLNGDTSVAAPDPGATILDRLGVVELLAGETKASLQAATGGLSAALKVSDLPAETPPASQARAGSSVLGLTPEKKIASFTLDSLLIADPIRFKQIQSLTDQDKINVLTTLGIQNIFQRLLPEGASVGQIPVRTSSGWGLGTITGGTVPVETPGGTGGTGGDTIEYATSISYVTASTNNMRTKIAQLQS